MTFYNIQVPDNYANIKSLVQYPIMSESTAKETGLDTENGLASKIEHLTVVSNGEAQPLPTSPVSSDKASNGVNPEDLVAAAERSLLQKVIRKGLVENKNDLEIQRKDPKSPLYSVKSFEALNLKPQLLKGVYSMGKTPNFYVN